jgi:hypothetical protein
MTGSYQGLRDRIMATDLVKREPWRFVLLMGLTMGLYSFYVVPRLALSVNRLTGKERFGFRVVMVGGILTIGLGLSVCEVLYAYALESNPGYAGGKWKTRYLFWYVLLLNILSWGLVFVPTGLAFAGSFAFGVLSTLMIQTEVNRYIELEERKR